MPRVRFRIRTIMIVIAVLAVLLGFLVVLLRWVALPEVDFYPETYSHSH